MELLKFLFNSLNNLTFSRNSLIPSEFQIYWRSHSSLPLIMSSAFWYAISLFLNSKYFLTSGAISTLAYRFFTGVLLNFQTFGEFLLTFVIILFAITVLFKIESLGPWEMYCSLAWIMESDSHQNWAPETNSSPWGPGLTRTWGPRKRKTHSYYSWSMFGVTFGVTKNR